MPRRSKQSNGQSSNPNSNGQGRSRKNKATFSYSQRQVTVDDYTEPEYMDPIDIVFADMNVEHLRLHLMGPRPNIKIDERGFVNFARELFKAIERRVWDIQVYCSELEFVYYSVAILRAQQLSRYNSHNVPYSGGDIFNFVSCMGRRHYPAIFDSYFDCLGMCTIEPYISYEMCLYRDEEEGEKGMSPHVSLSKLNKLLEVQDNQALYKELMAELFDDDDIVLNSISGHRYDKHIRSTVYGSDDKHLPEPFQFVNLEAIRDVEDFIWSINSKIKLTTIPKDLGMSPCLYPEVGLIRIDDYDKGSISSRFLLRGKPLMLAAMFQLYTPAVESERDESTSSTGTFSHPSLGPCDILVKEYVRTAFL